VFQAPYLIPFLDVTDNVALLPMLSGRPNAEARRRALELLEALDVAHRAGASRRSFPAANSNAWRLPAPWPISRR
jgi:ABC-type nitrate/sulfonate/bicarbonate transport system ATPase subunit